MFVTERFDKFELKDLYSFEDLDGKGGKMLIVDCINDVVRIPLTSQDIRELAKYLLEQAKEMEE